VLAQASEARNHNKVVERLQPVVDGVDKDRDAVVVKRQEILNVGIMIVGKNAPQGTGEARTHTALNGAGRCCASSTALGLA